LFAEDKYLTYVNKLINYHFELKNLPIKAPFEIGEVKNYHKTLANNNVVLSKRVKIELLSVFDNQARVLVEVFLGDQLIKSYKKWVKVGDKLYDCRVNKITLTQMVLKCKNKTLVKTVNQKIPFIKETK
jgi:hypothetical protein